MKIRSWVLCLGMVSSLHASIRNPFIMPISLCEVTLQQLDRWRLQGVIISPFRSLALMVNSHQQSVRVVSDTALMAGVTVTAMSQYGVSVSLADICDGGSYHWYLPGEKNDREDHYHTTVLTPPTKP